MTRVGITGHQSFSPATRELISPAMLNVLTGDPDLVGITSLAAGADQIFAELVLGLGGILIAVMPARCHQPSFADPADLARCDRLLAQAAEVLFMPYEQPCEEGYWQAGKEVVDRCDRLLAVWDGRPAAGLGGTADVVGYARAHGKPVTVLWPAGSTRG
jgi:hypothetical protein